MIAIGPLMPSWAAVIDHSDPLTEDSYRPKPVPHVWTSYLSESGLYYSNQAWADHLTRLFESLNYRADRIIALNNTEFPLAALLPLATQLAGSLRMQGNAVVGARMGTGPRLSMRATYTGSWSHVSSTRVIALLAGTKAPIFRRHI